MAGGELTPVVTPEANGGEASGEGEGVKADDENPTPMPKEVSRVDREQGK